VTNLAVKREGNVIKASWKNPGEYKNVKCMDIRAWFDRAGVKLTDTDIWYSNRGSEKALTYTASDRFWAKGFERASSLPTSFDKNYDRNRFHPVTAGKTLRKVQVGVAGYSNGFAPWTWVNYNFGLPRKPTISWDYNTSNNVATVTVETNEGKDAYERYDTMIMVKIRKQDGKEAVLMNWASTRSTKWQKSWDISAYLANMQAGKSVSIRCWAYARGIAGDNPSAAKAVYAERNIVFPLAGTVGKPTCDKKAAGGRIKIPVSSDSWSKQLQLQRKIGTGGWTDVSGATDNQNAKALYDSYGDVNPSAGVYVYYRIKATRDNYTNYSAQVRADCIYTAKPAETCSATCKLASLASNAAGTQVTVVMAWKDGTSNTGCELSWSEYANGWNTTDQPNVQQVTGKDSTSKLAGWTTKTYVISGLTSGKTYYVRMRRYKEYTGSTKYSAYDVSGYATAVKTESAGNDECGIAEVSVDGTTATITIGINENSANLGTEVTWADHEDAWQSNEQPASFNAEWARSAYGEQGWTYKQVVYLRGLEPGRTYWVKARRYDSGGTYSPYSKVKPFSIASGAAARDYDVRCGLVSVEPGEDGRTATVTIGWDGDHTGCEASWSDNPEAWESSSKPQSFEYDWTDAENQSGRYVLTQDTAIVVGKTYYTRSQTQPYVYTPVEVPVLADIATYYEYGYAWSHTSTCHITGLTEGTTYYVKARSYFSGDPKTYSAYTDDMTVTPYSAPDSVTLDAPSAIARGKAIECWWEISGDLPQVEWHMHDTTSQKTAIAEGTGTLCHASIEPDSYGDADAISFFVEAGCGGALTRSNTVTVGIADKPACEAYCSSTLTAQPSSFEVLTGDAGARLLATCYSRGCTLSAPDGDFDQLDGEAVWTQASTPSWEAVRWDETDKYAALSSEADAAQDAADDAQDAFEATDEYTAMATAKAALDLLTPEDEGYEEALAAYLEAYDAAYATAEGIALQDANAALEAATAALEAHADDDVLYSSTVTMPTSELLDGGMYYAEFRTVENVANLASDAAIAEFAVAYAHQAPEPSSAIEIATDAPNRKVVMTLTAPSTAAQTDVYDIYRQTPAGYELVAYGKDFGDEVTDLFVPFGDADTAYRIACRTVDGDIAWADYEYSLPVHVLRFDWDGESAEFPFNIQLRESMDKDFESRRHVDGTTNGYWDRGVEFSGSYSTDVIDVEDTELLRQARRLGSYAGAVWVRDAYGKAMQCNVDVREISRNYRSRTVGISFEITAMKTTEQFMLMGIEEEPEPEPEPEQEPDNG
jgi:hypothetical protein